MWGGKLKGPRERGERTFAENEQIVTDDKDFPVWVNISHKRKRCGKLITAQGCSEHHDFTPLLC